MSGNNVLRQRQFQVKIGPPWLTRFEKARIVGIRALQISLGAPVLIPLEGVENLDSIRIAEKELEMGVLPIIIVRWTPEGRFQEIPIKYLKLNPP
ncbi:DNA-directed RNA polymerase subunit K [Infirmifilum lucidum]|uniref:DNA-directed RNA polymerase subunit Rpo6 n=1 Tax=Infirmifilum lucidum TaxID=2776706 RepID=A0A7L9FEV8_9CREN|nr:DNA-directed RNA polymerase subunit K [Infirmifilum lucidum]QOJ78338.1 DNA-directed RNA polymerase subunit K [Infirmifilum lucidum]